MRLSYTIATLAAFGLATGCVNEQEQQAAVELQKHFSAQDCRIGHGFSADTGKGSKKTVTLTLEGVADFDQYRNKEYITSISALKYYQGQNATALEGYEEIEVKATSGSGSFEMSYPIEDMASVAPALEVVGKYFELLKQSNEADLPDLVDSVRISDSTMTRIIQEMQMLDSLNGVHDHATVLGFRFKRTTDKNEPVLVCWTEAINGGNNATNFQFYVNRESRKVIYIGVNDFE